MKLSKRIFAGLATASLALTVTACGGSDSSGNFDETVTVGILHSLSGTMAISESTLVDTEKMAIEEINAAGDKIPRKGGPGITRSDLLVINKIDLAPMVGASLKIMERDTLLMRKNLPWCFTNTKTGEGIEIIEEFLCNQIPSGFQKV